jgi:dihydrofolate synthase / folylpolyglutamate synthase
MHFKTHYEAIKWLESQLKFKPKTDLENMRKALVLLDLDLSQIQKIHVAGTNGKGSVCQFISHILAHKGLKVGTFTSPYVFRFNERILLNTEPISNKDLLEVSNFIFQFNLKFFEHHQEHLSFFELLTLMSLKFFSDQKVSYIVMEVGIGGLLDATNVLNYDVSIITSIGFDHMKQLGNTLESIALNKLGILKPNNLLITSVDRSLLPLFEDYAKKLNVEMIYTSRHQDIEESYVTELDTFFRYRDVLFVTPLVGEHQIDNALVSLKAVERLLPDITLNELFYGLGQFSFSGRMERLHGLTLNVIIDGAHNAHAIKLLTQNIKTLYPKKNVHVLMSILNDKDIHEMIEILRPAVTGITLTSFPDPRFVSLKPYESHDIKYIEDMVEAYHHIRTEKRPYLLIVTGSIHFIGYFVKTIYREHTKPFHGSLIKKKQSADKTTTYN